MRNVAFKLTRFQLGRPIVGVFVGLLGLFTEGLPNTYNNYSIPVDPISGKVFVAFDAITSATKIDSFSAAGCIAATAVPEPATLRLMAVALAGLADIVRRRA